MKKTNTEMKKSSTVKNIEKNISDIATFDKYAIFKTGGKQYQAVEGKTVAIEKIEGEIGSSLEFNEVLLRKTGEDKVEIGTPFLNGPIKASIVRQAKGPKLIVFRFKRRKKSRVKRGHRQLFTVVRIETI
ncbi:MAG: 50S ribosomal protein L21 [candidate division TM6 bacterium GW2011_GWF2_30_66]|jgi:large subunit ribosomal protein L21|nr:MAG: 50S ribosomal protein L21 [candidate division TM6 bacterium GW2011_GWF2_30_66]